MKVNNVIFPDQPRPESIWDETRDGLSANRCKYHDLSILEVDDELKMRVGSDAYLVRVEDIEKDKKRCPIRVVRVGPDNLSYGCSYTFTKRKDGTWKRKDAYAKSGFRLEKFDADEIRVTKLDRGF